MYICIRYTKLSFWQIFILQLPLFSLDLCFYFVVSLRLICHPKNKKVERRIATRFRTFCISEFMHVCVYLSICHCVCELPFLLSLTFNTLCHFVFISLSLSLSLSTQFWHVIKCNQMQPVQIHTQQRWVVYVIPAARMYNSSLIKRHLKTVIFYTNRFISIL